MHGFADDTAGCAGSGGYGGSGRLIAGAAGTSVPLGAPIFLASDDPVQLAQEHRRQRYGADLGRGSDHGLMRTT